MLLSPRVLMVSERVETGKDGKQRELAVDVATGKVLSNVADTDTTDTDTDGADDAR